MNAEIIPITSWQRVVNGARFSVKKPDLDHEPSNKFKHDMCRAEHSPLRLLVFDIRLYDIPYFVAMHLRTHAVAIQVPIVSTSRPDRTQSGLSNDELTRNTPVNMWLSCNAQGLIDISRKRLCFKASPETRKVWGMVIAELHKVDPILASYCVPNCLYRRHCTEPTTCGFYYRQSKRAIL